MRYVTVMSASGKVVAVGKLEQYYGKWLTVRRNDNEVVAVNTDFVQAIHFMEIPTQGMLESMLKSAPTVETAPPADGKRAPIAVKSTSNSRMPPSSIEEMMQNLVDNGPPGMVEGQAGAGLFSLPSNVKLPDGVSVEEVEAVATGGKVPRKRSRHDSK